MEQNNDKNGPIWHPNISPFFAHIIVMNVSNDDVIKLTKHCDSICSKLGETLVDSRKESFGTKLYDADLIGVPYSIVISKRSLESNTIEFINRFDGSTNEMSIKDLEEFLVSL